MTFIELNGEPFVCEPEVTIPAGGMLLWAPDAARFAVYNGDGSKLIEYVRVGDVFLGTVGSLI